MTILYETDQRDTFLYTTFPKKSGLLIQILDRSIFHCKCFFTDYACSPHFQEYPEDLSFMFVKAQEFLTIPNVMFRWFVYIISNGIQFYSTNILIIFMIHLTDVHVNHILYMSPCFYCF